MLRCCTQPRYRGKFQQQIAFFIWRKKATLSCFICEISSKVSNCIHCSKECSKQNIRRHQDSCWLNPVIKKLCVVCNSPIKNWKTNITCSYACSNTHFRTGESNGNWKQDSYRTTCFLYHGKKCILCPEENIVEVHHYDENRNNNSPKNLIPLCPTHHQYLHSKFKHLVCDKVDAFHLSIQNLRVG